MVKTHSAAWRNMIAGGAAYGYWALKSPVHIRPRELEKGSTVLDAPEPIRGGGVSPYLIDSPDFHGLSPPPRWGCFLSQSAGEPPAGQQAGLYFGGCSSLRSQPFARSDLSGSSRSHLAHSNPPCRFPGGGEPHCKQRESGIACPMARNLRLEPQQVHSKYNPCGRKFDSVSFSGSTRRAVPPRGDGLPRSYGCRRPAASRCAAPTSHSRRPRWFGCRGRAAAGGSPHGSPRR